jgi:hypothetical protein
VQSPGWTFRAQSAVASGTTSLSINMPSGTSENDIMLMWLTHKGAGYATVPAGWNLVAQNISGSTRGELYWKRAGAGEAGPYSVTGLADTALGMIASYIGGLLSGTVIDVSNSIANASGTYTTPQVTTTVPNALLVSSVHVGANSSVGTQGTGGSFGNTNLFSNFGEWDEQLLTMRTLTNTGTATGTDCRLAVADAGKPIPAITGALAVQSAFTGENVRIVAALIPETSQLSAGTRFYFANGPTFQRINELPDGDWDSDAYGPNNLGNATLTRQLITNKLEGFHIENGNWVTNRQGNYDELIGRFVTKPIEAQNISGTIDIAQQISVRFLDTSGLTNLTSARWKLHVYIAVGQTGVVRHVLLDNFIDTADINNTSTVLWVQLAAGAQALTPGDAEEGDTIIVELGIRIVSSPTPVPTYPPTEYSRITMSSAFGTTLAGNNTSNCVGAQDPTIGTSTTSRCAYIDFSDTITFAADPAPPANDDYAGRTTIPATLPFQSSPLDVSGALSNARTVWYEWTPAISGNVGLFLLGSNYHAQVVVLTGTPGAFSAESDYQDTGLALQRGLTACSWDAVQGTTYIIGVYLTSFTNQTAGELWLTMTWRDLVPAEGDVYIPSLNIYSYRDGLPINWGALSFTPSGCVIDYSQLPLTDLETGLPNTNERIVINSFGGSMLTEILDLDTFDRNEAEVDFIFDAWNFFNGENCAALAMDRSNALVISCQWGNGFLDVNDLGTTGSVPAFFNEVSDAADEGAVYRTSIQNGDNTGAPVVTAEQFAGLAVNSTTPWYGAVSDADASILYYVSAGFYIEPRTPAGSYTIKRYNLDTTTQLADFATVTCTGPAAASGPHGLCVHDGDGSIFVCTGSTIQRFSSDGTLINTYAATGDFGYDGQDLWDCHIHPDGTTLIAIDGQSMTVFEWDIESEVQTNYFQTWLSQGNFTQFAIYQPSPLPPPSCPGDITGTVDDGLPYAPVSTAPCGGTGTRSGSVTGQ